MPLLRKRPFICEKPPAHLKPNDLVFYCKLTGEAFTDYESVLSLYDYYHSHIFVVMYVCMYLHQAITSLINSSTR